jgi:hypothetical protein
MKVNYKKKKNQIPHIVKLGPKKKSDYEIVWRDNFSSDHVMGETTFDKKQIRIKTGMNDKDTVVTYLHELAHAISEETGANLTETQILCLEKVFYYLLKDNNIFIKEEK